MPDTQPQRPFVGAHLILIQDDTILMMKRTVKDGMDGYYALVAGKVDEFESPRVALAREAFEEVGVTIDPQDLEIICIIHHAKTDYKAQKHDVIEFYFKAKTWSGTPVNLEPDKASELKFFPLDNLPQPLPKALPHVLKALNGGPRFVEL
jgi:ADP-ribose pyrophosphatase YjhB (NUDIX family)